MPQFVRRHPFVLLGLLSLCLFFSVDALSRTGHTATAAAAARPLRVLIVPMYAVWLPFTMLSVAVAGPNGVPGTVARLIWMCGLVAGFAPYTLADYMLARWLRAQTHRDTVA